MFFISYFLKFKQRKNQRFDRWFELLEPAALMFLKVGIRTVVGYPLLLEQS